MNWRAVARREVRDAGRSRVHWTVVGLFAAVGVATVVIPAVAIGGLSTERSLAFLVAPLKLVVGLTGLFAGYSAIAGARSGGQLKLTLGLPIERSALVVGAVLGRSVVVLAGTAIGLAAIAVALLGVYGAVPLARLTGFAALLALFGVTVTAIAVGLSAAARPGASRRPPPSVRSSSSSSSGVSSPGRSTTPSRGRCRAWSSRRGSSCSSGSSRSPRSKQPPSSSSRMPASRCGSPPRAPRRSTDRTAHCGVDSPVRRRRTWIPGSAS